MRQLVITAFFATAALCSADQLNLKPLEYGSKSKAADKNREAIKSYLKGDLKKASDLLDDASLNDLNDPVPWINGSLLNLELGKLAQASRANREGILLGEQSVRARSISVEIEAARGQLAVARRRLRLTEFLMPEDPYVHESRAKLATVSGDFRTAERSTWQAMRFGKEAMLDSRLDSDTKGDVGFGADGHGNAILKGRTVGNSFSSKYKLEAITENLAATAKQKLVRADFKADTPLGQVMFAHRGLRSERTGTTIIIPGVPNLPFAELDFRYSLAGWQMRRGPWTTNATYREANAKLKSTTLAPLLRDNFETQWMGEMRYDRDAWTFGAGASRVYKNGVASPAIEPLEEVFNNGRTSLAHAYAVHRKNFGDEMRLITGIVGERIGGRTHVLASGEFAVRLIGNEFLRIGVKPTMNRVGTNIFPEDLRGGRLVENPIDSAFGSTQDFNQAPYLMKWNGKSTNVFAEVPLIAQGKLQSSLSLSQKQFTNAMFVSTSSQQANQLLLTPVKSGSITGITSTTSASPSQNVSVSASFTVQKSASTYANTTVNIGAVSAAQVRQVPNVANFVSTLTADFNLGSATLAVAGNYVGKRVTALTNGDRPGGKAETYLTTASPVWGVDMHLSLLLGNGSLRISGLNLGQKSFYQGSTPNRQVFFTYISRF